MHTHTYIYIYTYTYIHTYIHTYINTHTYIHTHMHTHTYTIHTYIHTYIRTNARALLNSSFVFQKLCILITAFSKPNYLIARNLILSSHLYRTLNRVAIWCHALLQEVHSCASNGFITKLFIGFNETWNCGWFKV